MIMVRTLGATKRRVAPGQLSARRHLPQHESFVRTSRLEQRLLSLGWSASVSRQWLLAIVSAALGSLVRGVVAVPELMNCEVALGTITDGWCFSRHRCNTLSLMHYGSGLRCGVATIHILLHANCALTRTTRECGD